MTLIESARRKLQKAELLKQNAADIAAFKDKQKEKRERAYANLAKHGEEFVGIAKFFLPFQQSQELMAERRRLAKMQKWSVVDSRIGSGSVALGSRTYGD